jgi:hypothetical protein
VAALLFASGAVLALPSERSDKTPMVNGTVRAIEQVGTNIWLGGKFTQVKRHKGTAVVNVSNLAVFDSKTNQYNNIAPKLGGTHSEVWDMTLYGENDVLIAGSFSGPTSNPEEPGVGEGLLRQGTQALDPNDECKTRKGIAAYSLGWQLDPDWSPTYAGKYSLVWALHVEGARLHTGGEFLTVNGVTQNCYARLS